MSPQPTPTIGRRALLRNGALTLSVGAIVAACGDRGGSDDPGRLGVAPPAPELTDEEVSDVVLLRTAQSLEYTAIEVYDALRGHDALDGDELALVEGCAAAHQRDADALGAAVTELGGEPFECTNPFLHGRAVTPVLDALEGSDDLRSDVLNVAYAFEQLLGASHQALVGSLADAALRPTAMTIGSGSLRRAAALAAALNPDSLFSPTLSGEQEETDDRGLALRYAVPSAFG